MAERVVMCPDITCEHCAAAIRRELGELEGVRAVEADATTKKVVVRWEAPADWDGIQALLEEIGYPPEA